MRQYFRIAGKIESGIGYLCYCLGISLIGMFFINELIGGMGGLPAFSGLLAVFYQLRIVAISREHLNHQLALGSRREIAYYLCAYGVGYLLVWGTVKLILIFSHILGWGNIDGLTAKEYFQSIYGSTMLERWAYFAAGILMFAYVVSLFPLVVMRKKRSIAWYFLADVLVFASVCVLIRGFCQIWITEGQKKPSLAVLDSLLLCRQKKYQAGLFLVAGILLVAAATVAAFTFAHREYAAHKGNISKIPTELTEWSKETFVREKYRTKKRIILAAVISVTMAGGLFATAYAIVSAHLKQGPVYHKAAECLTKDKIFGPAVYENEVFVPVAEELTLHETEQVRGYFAYKDQNCENQFYQLVLANYLYISGGRYGTEYLERYGADQNFYRKASSVEKLQDWKEDEIFVLWDEEWTGNDTYGDHRTGYTICERQLIENLESQFGAVSYRAEDFSDYDAYFTISSYANPAEVYGDELKPGAWIGCILVKDNNFYYGNKSNHIEGTSLNQLLDTLGGHVTPTEPTESSEP